MRRWTVGLVGDEGMFGASLALGVWLGANGKMDFIMPSAITGGVALNDDGEVDDLGGVGDAYAEAGTT